MPTTTTAIGYVRVSTEMQVQDGVSLEMQRAQISAYCDLYGIVLCDIEADEGASARDLNRPGLRRALERLESGEACMLVVVKLDRLTRSVRDLGDLLQRYFQEGGFFLASVQEKIDTTTAGGRLTLNILASVSQWEREVISERISLAMQHMIAQNKRVGYIPFGKRLAPDGIHLEDCPSEQLTLAKIDLLRSKGASLRTIATTLNTQGVLNRTRPWSAMTVRQKLMALENM